MEYAFIAIAGFLFGSSFNMSDDRTDWNKVGAPVIGLILSVVSALIYVGKLKAGVLG